VADNLRAITQFNQTPPSQPFQQCAGGAARQISRNRQTLKDYAAIRLDFRVLEEPAVEIMQAMAAPYGRRLAAKFLDNFLADLKISGFLENALQRCRQAQAVVA
jgi:hypothetical protein